MYIKCTFIAVTYVVIHCVGFTTLQKIGMGACNEHSIGHKLVLITLVIFNRIFADQMKWRKNKLAQKYIKDKTRRKCSPNYVRHILKVWSKNINQNSSN